MKTLTAGIFVVLFATNLGGCGMAKSAKNAGSGNRFPAGMFTGTAGPQGIPYGVLSPNATVTNPDQVNLGLPAQYGTNQPAATPDTTGGGGGGGGSGGGYDPSSDPTYQAYIANLDLTQQQQQADTARKIGDLQAAQTMNLGNIATAGQASQRNINGGYEGRGLYNSGARLNDLSIQSANQASQENQVKQGTATGISDLEAALANAVAQMSLKRQSAGQGVFQ